MKKLSFALVGAAALALAACGGQGDDTLGENVQENYENAAENLDAVADNTANGAEADASENQADALANEGENKEEAIDEADVNAANRQRDVIACRSRAREWNGRAGAFGPPALFLRLDRC